MTHSPFLFSLFLLAENTMKNTVEKARCAYAKAQRLARKTGDYSKADRLFAAYVAVFAASVSVS